MDTTTINEALKNYGVLVHEVHSYEDSNYFIYEFEKNGLHYADLCKVSKKSFIVKTIQRRIEILNERINLKIVKQPSISSLELDLKKGRVFVYVTLEKSSVSPLASFRVELDGFTYCEKDGAFEFMFSFEIYADIYLQIDKKMKALNVVEVSSEIKDDFFDF